MRHFPCTCFYDDPRTYHEESKDDPIVIGRDGFPVEMVKGQRIKNFIRKYWFGHHTQLRECYKYKRELLQSFCSVFENDCPIEKGSS